MQFELLGPVRVAGDDGGWREIRGAMPRAVLAALLLHPNTVVSADELVELVWSGRAPASALASLQNHVMRLRRMIGDEGGARIRSVAPGYLITIGPGELDLDDFEALCAEGAQAGRDWQWAKSAAALSGALALWRGQPVADVPALGGHPRIQQLRDARLRALSGRIEADLELGRHRVVIGELHALTAQYPVHEDFHAQLMLALYRADRQAEALDNFVLLRRTLSDEFGVEPSAPVQELHRRILNADPELAAPTLVTADTGTEAGDSRAQLPADTRVFTGRARELEELIAQIDKAPVGTDAGMVVISAIDGMGGIGKTTLAVHVAHQVRDQFPDGQLFLDLNGYNPDAEPMSSGDALAWFLRSLGAAPKSIPEDLGERAAFYRDRLHGTKTLIILDNAAGAAQVRPLLPGSPGCLVLITSRRRLTGLDDAHTMTLGTLPEDDAIALLHKVAGPGRIPAHHPGIGELLALCGHMPLAIRITAARLRQNPALRLDEVIAQLRDETARLGHLTAEDRNLTVVFEASYTTLPEAEQRMFRLLGLIPGTSWDAYAAAGLINADHHTAERLLESLLDHNLLIQHTAGRYRFHDLVRAYARTLCADEEREAALDRLLDYYQHTAYAADRHLARDARPGPTPSAAPSPAAPELSDRVASLTWMRTERDNLLAAVTYAGAHAWLARAVALTAALAPLLRLEGPWSQAIAVHRAAAALAHEDGDRLEEANALQDQGRVENLSGHYAAAVGLHERALTIYQDLGDRLGEAHAQHHRGRALLMIGDFPPAVEQLERSLVLYQELGDRFGEVTTIWSLGRVRYTTNDYQVAIGLHERALPIYRELGDRLGEAHAMHDLGRARFMTGDYAVAGELLEQAQGLFQEFGDRLGEANSVFDLGRLRYITGDYAAAVTQFEQGLVLYRDLGNRHGEGIAQWNLGRVRLATGDYPAADDLFRRALAIFQQVGNRHSETVALFDLGRVQLAAGDHPSATELLERALASFQELDNRHGVANALQELGRVRHAAGDEAAAAGMFERALALFREIGDPQGVAEALNSTAAFVADTTGPQEALALYRQALQIAREVTSPVDEARALDGAADCLARIGDRAAALAELEQAVAIYRRIGAAGTAAAEARLAALRAEDS